MTITIENVVEDAVTKVTALKELLALISDDTNNIKWKVDTWKTDTMLNGKGLHNGEKINVDIAVHVHNGAVTYDIGIANILKGFTTSEQWEAVSYIQELDNGITGA